MKDEIIFSDDTEISSHLLSILNKIGCYTISQFLKKYPNRKSFMKIKGIGMRRSNELKGILQDNKINW